eukprot:6799822-Prymnesium_polylepis.3
MHNVSSAVLTTSCPCLLCVRRHHAAHLYICVNPSLLKRAVLAELVRVGFDCVLPTRLADGNRPASGGAADIRPRMDAHVLWNATAPTYSALSHQPHTARSPQSKCASLDCCVYCACCASGSFGASSTIYRRRLQDAFESQALLASFFSSATGLGSHGTRCPSLR